MRASAASFRFRAIFDRAVEAARTGSRSARDCSVVPGVPVSAADAGQSIRFFTSLHHLIDEEWMLEAYRRTRKDGATGIDGVTAADYEKELEANLADLLSRIKSGRYYAPPMRRQYIPKADGSQRPPGIPTFEDKVVQRAILMLLEPIYEADFLPCSYGFRPGQSGHNALAAVRAGVMDDGHRWVIDGDIKKYYDTISHRHLRSFLDLRIKDGVIRRMIDKWLSAGVLEEGTLRRSDTGTPQGGVVSPILSERSDNNGYGNPMILGT